MSMFPSQDPMLARAIIEERHRSADRSRRARQARRARAGSRHLPQPTERRFGAVGWLRRVARAAARPAFRRNADAAPETGR